MKIHKHKLSQGFTIIEVMIVLAIAALILLIVFLAVPGLERSQRNNARKNDISRISASLISYYANNGGLPAGGANATATITALENDWGTLGGYTSLGNGGATLTNGDVDIVTAGNGTPAALPVADTDTIQIVDGGICNGAGATNVGANATHSMAVEYTLEASSGSTVYCQNVQ